MSDNKETWVEELEVSGKEAVEKVRVLIQQGNVRRIIVRKNDGESLIDLPLTPTVVGAGVLTVFAGPLMLLGALAALFMELRIEVVREIDPEADEPNIKHKIDVD